MSTFLNESFSIGWASKSPAEKKAIIEEAVDHCFLYILDGIAEANSSMQSIHGTLTDGDACYLSSDYAVLDAVESTFYRICELTTENEAFQAQYESTFSESYMERNGNTLHIVYKDILGWNLGLVLPVPFTEATLLDAYGVMVSEFIDLVNRVAA